MEGNYELVTNLSDIQCTKNPGHTNFFSVRDYKGKSLPQDYQNDPELLQHVKNQADITTLLKINGTSDQRSDYSPTYPFSDEKDRQNPTHGTGWLDFISKYKRGQECPCPECKQSGSPHKGWAKVYINTATHVVFNGTEGRKTTCYFDYDKEGDDYQNCPSLCNAVEVVSSPVADKSVLTFICHDEDLSKLLLAYFEGYSNGLRDLKQKYKDPAAADDSDLDPETKSVRLLERLKKLMGDLGLILSKLRLKRDRDKPHLLIGSLNNLSKTVGETYNSLENSTMNNSLSYKVHQKFTERTENEVRRVAHVLIKDHTELSNVETHKSDDRLTIIVSHPHGCSKRITTGKVIERRSGFFGEFRCSEYLYDTPTCPGSSGAQAFLIGRGLGISIHTHSQGSDQLNNSGLDFDD